MQAGFTLDYDVLTVERPQKVYLMARLEAGPAPGERQRRPLNISLVIDRSGSMSGDKIDYTRQAAQFLVQNLSVQDTFSIVIYNDVIETLLPPQIINNKDLICQRINNIKVGGTTNLSGGWLEGCKYVAEHVSDERMNRVILMSDGLANRGITDSGKLVGLAQQKRGERITTTTMGLGTEFNEELLMAMADAGGGAYYFIESPEVAPIIFEEELNGLLSVVGQNLVIGIETTEHVTGVNQLNVYPMHSDGRRVSYRLGDVFGNEEKTLLLELSIPALKDMGEQQIATLYFEYDAILPDNHTEHRTWELPVLVNVAPEGEQPRLVNPDVQRSVLLLQAAQARREAVEAADRGEYQSASQILRNIADAIENTDLQDEQLAEEKSALEQQADDLEKGSATYDNYSRISMATQAFYTMTDRHDGTMVLRARENERRAPKSGVFSVEKQPGVTPTQASWTDQTFALNHDLIRLGRSSHNEIVIKANGVSRFHCQIRREGDKLILEDLGSTNGTSINGEALTGQHILSVGDEVLLCDEVLIFH